MAIPISVRHRVFESTLYRSFLADRCRHCKQSYCFEKTSCLGKSFSKHSNTIHWSHTLVPGPNNATDLVLQAQRHARIHEYWPSSGWIPQAVMRISLHPGPIQLITAEQVKAMSVTDHQQLWKVADSSHCTQSRMYWAHHPCSDTVCNRPPPALCALYSGMHGVSAWLFHK